MANPDVLRLTKDPNNWAIWGGNYAGQRYSELNQINATNVGKLQVAWTFSTGVLRGHEGGPMVIGDTLYVHTPFPNKVYAINLNDQSIIWEYKPNQNPDTIPVMCCDTVNRGLAYAEGTIFLQQADTNLVALDAKTGAVKWKIRNGDPKVGSTNTNAPVVIRTRSSGISGGVRRARLRRRVQDCRRQPAWLGYSTGPTRRC
jgi:glucose dehydrogenase